MSAPAHRAAAPAAVRCFVITVSDTRTEETDSGGRAVVRLLTDAGHIVEGKRILRDEPADVAALVRTLAGEPLLDVIITTGGTGITRRDSTFEALDGLLDKRLPGFGELFRMLSFQEIGPAAMLSRACAGLHRGKVVVALPGSEHAVRLAMTRLVVPELGHLVAETRR